MDSSNNLGKRGSYIDPVKQQRILISVLRKEKICERERNEKWSFYIDEKWKMLEEIALEKGFTKKEFENYFKRTLRRKEIENIDSEKNINLPRTSNGVIGYNSNKNLEIFGKLSKTQRDYPTTVPLKKGQVYDPYKQTMIFLGSVCGDPISYQLKPQVQENVISQSILNKPVQLDVAPLSQEYFNKALQ